MDKLEQLTERVRTLEANLNDAFFKMGQMAGEATQLRERIAKLEAARGLTDDSVKKFREEFKKQSGLKL